MSTQKSAESLMVVGGKLGKSGNTFDMRENLSQADDMVILGDRDGPARSIATAHTRLRKVMRSSSMETFNTLGSGYTVPRHDHKYHIKHAYRFGNEDRTDIKSNTYMSQVIERAKSSIDPRKYTPQVDWK